jgi:hypothetical protein
MRSCTQIDELLGLIREKEATPDSERLESEAQFLRKQLRFLTALN